MIKTKVIIACITSFISMLCVFYLVLTTPEDHLKSTYFLLLPTLVLWISQMVVLNEFKKLK